MKSFYKKYPKRTITSAIDYDQKWYLFLAVENPKEIDYDCPIFAVNKQNGEVRSYSPMDELEKYTNAVRRRSIKLK